RQTDGADAEFFRKAKQNIAHRWMEMKMMMRVDVIEPQAGGAERFELRADFGGDLAPRSRAEKNPSAEHGEVVGKTARRIDQTGQLLRRQHRPAVNQDEMEPDAQVRH